MSWGLQRSLYEAIHPSSKYSCVGQRQDSSHSPLRGLQRARPLLGHVGPVATDEADEALRAENPKAEARVDLEAPAIHRPALVVGQSGPVATPRHGVLHVPPRQLRTGIRRCMDTVRQGVCALSFGRL